MKALTTRVTPLPSLPGRLCSAAPRRVAFREWYGVMPVVLWSGVSVGAAEAFETASLASPLAALLRPVLFVGQSLMLLRIVLSWFPEVKETELPWLIAYIPTEPVLSATRRVIPPAFGVDISPVVWLALFSFVGEILIGPQGVLNLIQRSI